MIQRMVCYRWRMATEWVRARAACTTAGVFERLRAVIRRDAASAKAVGIRAEVSEESRERIVVTVEDELSVAVRASDAQIEVHTQFPYDKACHVFTPMLTHMGKIRLRDKSTGEVLKPWQVSRRALEDLLFADVRWR